MSKPSEDYDEKAALEAAGLDATQLAAASRPARIEIPTGVDAAIRKAARDRAAAISGRKSRILRLSQWSGAVAAAAAVLLAVGVFVGGDRAPQEGGDSAAATSMPSVEAPKEKEKPSTLNLAMDIDSNGTVDIVDAFLLSRRIDQENEVTSDCDFDRNGRVDSADVDAVAVAAVSL